LLPAVVGPVDTTAINVQVSDPKRVEAIDRVAVGHRTADFANRQLRLWSFFDRNLLHSNVTREDLAIDRRVAACAVVRPFDPNFSPECSLSVY
jgi:hypothetical protein